MDLPFHPDAMADLETAIAWYKEERTGLADAFYEEIKRVVAWAARFPRGGPRILGLPTASEVRRVRLKKFPYVIVTILGEQDEPAIILAVMHTSRHPEYWFERLP